MICRQNVHFIPLLRLFTKKRRKKIFLNVVKDTKCTYLKFTNIQIPYCNFYLTANVYFYIYFLGTETDLGKSHK